MASRLKVDASSLKEFEKQLKQLQEEDMQQFNEQTVKELATRLLEKVIDRTKPGQYPPSSGKQGGTLRRGWTAKTEQEAMDGTGDGRNILEYVNLLNVNRENGSYIIEINNPVHYASYVEYGHRKRGPKGDIGGDGWVPGKFMLTISEQQLEAEGPAIIERRLKAFLKEALDGK